MCGKPLILQELYVKAVNLLSISVDKYGWKSGHIDIRKYGKLNRVLTKKIGLNGGRFFFTSGNFNKYLKYYRDSVLLNCSKNIFALLKF